MQAGELVRGGTSRSFPAWLVGLCATFASAHVVHAAEGLELPTTAAELGALVVRSAPLAFVVFPILAFAVNKLLLAPLVTILTEREARTSGALQRAAELRLEAAKGLDELEGRLREARVEAQRTRTAMLAQSEAEERRVLDLARDEAARASAAVRSSVASELEVARATLRGQAAGLAREAATQILGRAL